jgi:hypothetical protein
MLSAMAHHDRRRFRVGNRRVGHDRRMEAGSRGGLVAGVAESVIVRT